MIGVTVAGLLFTPLFYTSVRWLAGPGRKPATAPEQRMTEQPLTYDDTFIRRILETTKRIAMVGVSPNDMRPSYFAMLYLQNKGYVIDPINPRSAGEKILGRTVYASLDDLPEPPDMVDVFRKSADVPPIADAAIRLGAKTLWLQLGVRHDEAAAKAEAAGLQVVQNRCPKIEHGRLFGEIGWLGVNRRTISGRKGEAMQLKTKKGRLL